MDNPITDINSSDQNKSKPKNEELKTEAREAAPTHAARKYPKESSETAQRLTLEFRSAIARIRPSETPPPSTFGRDKKFMCLICSDWLERWGEDHIKGMWAEFVRYRTNKAMSLDLLGFYSTRELLHHEQIKCEENSAGRRPVPARDPYGI